MMTQQTPSPSDLHGLPIAWLLSSISSIERTLGKLESGQTGIHTRLDDTREQIIQIRSDLGDRMNKLEARERKLPPMAEWPWLQIVAIVILAALGAKGTLQPEEVKRAALEIVGVR